LKFYPPGNDTFAYIGYLARFAVGFLVRPFDALFFGRIGDLVGRKYAFLVTLTIMGGATFLIGLMPTYKTAGWFAPIVLILTRISDFKIDDKSVEDMRCLCSCVNRAHGNLPEVDTQWVRAKISPFISPSTGFCASIFKDHG
jgi:hypothetical protein